MISHKMTSNLCGTKNLIWFQAKNDNFILSLNPKSLFNIIIKAEKNKNETKKKNFKLCVIFFFKGKFVNCLYTSNPTFSDFGFLYIF